MGITFWSPPLDDMGNTVRGVQFSEEFVKLYNFHKVSVFTMRTFVLTRSVNSCMLPGDWRAVRRIQHVDRPHEEQVRGRESAHHPPLDGCLSRRRDRPEVVT